MSEYLMKLTSEEIFYSLPPGRGCQSINKHQCTHYDHYPLLKSLNLWPVLISSAVFIFISWYFYLQNALHIVALTLIKKINYSRNDFFPLSFWIISYKYKGTCSICSTLDLKWTMNESMVLWMYTQSRKSLMSCCDCLLWSLDVLN